MLGRGYAVECCAAAFRHRQEEKQYRAYLTDALNAIAGNTTRYVVPGVGIVEQGEKMGARWIEIADGNSKPKPEKEQEDTRTAREIADGIWARMRGGESR